MNEEEKKEQLHTIVKEPVEEKIKQIINDGIRQENVDYLYKLIDVHKDLCNENYWKEKLEMMRYRNYSDNYSNYEDSYGRRGVPGTGRGRYRDGGSYGRRGVPGTGRYRGDEYLGEMMDSYHDYRDGRDNYGADDQTMESFKYMLKSFKDYYKHLKNEASSQDEIRMLEETAHDMLNM